jgi:endoribonuclease Dicer
VCIADPVTGGTISSSDAVRVVLCLASTLSPHTKSSVHELLTYMKQGSKYICTVHIPQLLPTDVSSSLCSTLTQARRDACFQACAKLQAEGLLAPRFFRPLPVDSTIGQNEPEKKKGTQGTPRRTTSFWQRCINATAGTLYPTLLRFDQQGSVDRTTLPTGAEGSSVLILTRRPLPELNPFPVYDWGDSSRLETSRAVLNRGAPFEITSLQLELLYRYTLRVSRMITNKRFVCAMDQIAYLLAPMVGPPANNVILQSLAPLPVIHTAIAWDQVEMTSTTPVLPFVLEDLEYAPGYVVQERAHEFTKRFFVTHVRKDLSPLSKPEPGCVCFFC